MKKTQFIKKIVPIVVLNRQMDNVIKTYKE